jgi:cytochrome c oxidase cbb3-type subunit IV
MNAIDYSTFSSAMTVVMLVVFLGIVAWAYSAKRRAQFDEASRVPFEDEATLRHDCPNRTGQEKS